MPKRYLMGKRPLVGRWSDDLESEVYGEEYLGRTVFELEPVVMSTGILDQYGDPILYTDGLDPIGFTRF